MTNDYDAVDALAAVLRARPLTAAAIARIFHCARPIAYARIRALRDRGVRLVETEIREGRTGPTSTAYAIKRVAKNGT